MARPTCESCQAFAILTNECRRKSPLAVPLQKTPGQLQFLGAYPGTHKEGWCCEHLPDGSLGVKLQ